MSGSDSTARPRGLARVAPGLAMLREYRVEWLRHDVLAKAKEMQVVIQNAGYRPISQ